MRKIAEKSKSLYVFIDASNVWEVQKAEGRLFDYKKVTNFLADTFEAEGIKVFYYSAYPADGTRDYDLDGKHKFFTFLKKGLDFEVRKKELKRITAVNDHGEYVVEKGNMDVEMTLDAVHHKEKYDTAILFSGDSDFLPLVAYLRKHGKRIYVFSSQNNISHELRTGADGYYDILALNVDVWGGELKHRFSKRR